MKFLTFAIVLFVAASSNNASPLTNKRQSISIPGIGNIDIGGIASDISSLLISSIIGFGDGTKINFLNERCVIRLSA
jgi:hypothetical protein